MNAPLQLSRRDLLKGSGALVVAFSLAPNPEALAQDASATKPVSLDQVDTFLAIDERGMVTLYAGKVDLGTGVNIGLAQIVAEELDVPLANVSLVTGDTALTPDQGPTYGSQSIQSGGMQIRQAAATARNALLDQAAQRLNVAKDDLAINEGVIAPKAGGTGVAYQDLIGGKDFMLKVDPAAPMKSPADYKLVGKPIARRDIPEKLTGKFTYMHDFRVPGMLHGSVIRPPALGATLQNVDESSIKDVPGVVKLVRDGDFLGVVTETEWAAVRVARELRTTWSDSETLPEQQKLWEHVTRQVLKDDVTSFNIGNASAALAASGKKLSASYDFAIHTHGSIGPSCAIAEFKHGKLTSWTASQATHSLRKQLAKMFSMALGDVRCIYVDGAGCYGRNGHEDAAADAALLAKAVDKPVRVQWSRADEHGWDPKGPPTDRPACQRRCIGKRYGVNPRFFIPQGRRGTVDLVAATLSDKPVDGLLSPGGIIGDPAIGYKFPNIRTVCHRLRRHRCALLDRTPGRMQNTFANECFLDEDCRPQARIHSKFESNIPILPTSADSIYWIISQNCRTGRSGHRHRRTSPGNIVKGRGVSYVKYELVRTYVGVVVEIEVDRTAGNVQVTKVYVVHDCGQIINPKGVQAQVEGNVIQTVSRTLKEEVTFDRSMVTSLDWASYPILTFPELPEIVIELIDRPTEKPWGAGEPTAAVVPSAISNAIFDATGARIRSVPFKAAKLQPILRSIM
jgi:CO/xanthine dehydrogenase Mo-binding subunit